MLSSRTSRTRPCRSASRDREVRWCRIARWACPRRPICRSRPRGPGDVVDADTRERAAPGQNVRRVKEPPPPSRARDASRRCRRGNWLRRTVVADSSARRPHDAIAIAVETSCNAADQQETDRRGARPSSRILRQRVTRLIPSSAAARSRLRDLADVDAVALEPFREETDELVLRSVRDGQAHRAVLHADRVHVRVDAAEATVRDEDCGSLGLFQVGERCLNDGDETGHRDVERASNRPGFRRQQVARAAPVRVPVDDRNGAERRPDALDERGSRRGIAEVRNERGGLHSLGSQGPRPGVEARAITCDERHLEPLRAKFLCYRRRDARPETTHEDRLHHGADVNERFSGERLQSRRRSLR